MDKSYEGVVERIQNLSAEQLKIYTTSYHGELTDGQRKRLVTIKETLKELWLERKQLRHLFQDPVDKLIGETRIEAP